MAFDLGSVTAHLKSDISGFKSGINEAKGLVGSFTGKTGDIVGALTKVASVAAVAGTALATMFAKKGIDAAMQFEQQTIGFTTLLKSEEKAIAAIKKIETEAKVTPFNLPELIKANQLLISAGVNSDDALVQIRNLGNAISATGGGNDELQRMAVNMQQIKSLGKATALDVRQFAFAGINIYALLAEATGKSVDEVREMDVSYEDLTSALAKASEAGGMFEGAMQKQSLSLAGIKSNLQDVLGITLKNIVVQTGLYDVIKTGAGSLVTFLTENGPKIGEFINQVVANVKFFVDQIIGFFNEWIKPAMMALVEFFRAHWDSISLIFLGAWNFIKGVVQVAWAIVEGIIKVGLAIIAGDWGKAWQAIKEMLAQAWEGIKNIFSGMIDFLKGWGGLIIDRLVQPFEEAWNKIKEFVNKIKEQLDFTKRHSPSVVDIVNRGVQKVNDALSGLAINPNFGAPATAMAIGAGTSGGGIINHISVDMSGAIIANEASALEMGEKIGDSIIKKLKQSVRI